jgi:hypothetical protein
VLGTLIWPGAGQTNLDAFGGCLEYRAMILPLLFVGHKQHRAAVAAQRGQFFPVHCDRQVPVQAQQGGGAAALDPGPAAAGEPSALLPPHTQSKCLPGTTMVTGASGEQRLQLCPSKSSCLDWRYCSLWVYGANHGSRQLFTRLLQFE